MSTEIITYFWTVAAALPLEIWFFGIASVVAVATACFAWANGSRMGQPGMVALYFLLTASLFLAVTSLVDFADVSLLGERSDTATGMLLGGLTAVITVGAIAVRLRGRFPSALAWWLALTLTGISRVVLDFGSLIDDDFRYLLHLAATSVGCGTILVIRRIRSSLSDNQYVAAIAAAGMFVYYSAPYTPEVNSADILSNLLRFLVAYQFLQEREDGDPIIPRAACVLLILSSVAGIIPPLLQKITGMNDTLSGLPLLPCGVAAVMFLRTLRPQLPPGVYGSSLIVIGSTVLISMLPQSSNDGCVLLDIGTSLLFVITCIWREAVSETGWSWRLRTGLSVSGIAVTVGCCTVAVVWSCLMLVDDVGAARVLAELEGTPLWPGDAAFVKLALQEESCWPLAVKNIEPGSTNLNDYLNSITPDSDRFSAIIPRDEYELKKQGITPDSLGILCQLSRSRDALMLLRVDAQSPAGRLGLKRGEEILQINDRAVKDTKGDDAWETLMGGKKAGQLIRMSVRDRSHRLRSLSLKIDSARRPPPFGTVITGRIGYLYLETFSTDDITAVDTLFATFKAAGVRDLVLDLRYNGGGYLDNVHHLANLIAGTRFPDRVFLEVRYNQRFHDRDNTRYLKAEVDSLAIRHLVVLTTDMTCSASEAIINGLRPYMQVTTIGTPTCGKAYSMEHITFGKQVLMPVNAVVLNSRGETIPDSGIAPDIPVADDARHDVSDPGEGMLSKALEVLRNGVTSPARQGAGHSLSGPGPPPGRNARPDPERWHSRG